MKLIPLNLARLRQPLAGALLTLIAAGILCTSSIRYARDKSQELNQARQHKNQSEHLLTQARSEEQQVKEQAALYRQLKSAGMIGMENRLAWTEKHADISKSLQLPGMHYEFGRQTILAATEHLDIFSTPLHLQLHLTHENDLLRTIDLIEQENSALVLLHDCLLERPNLSDAGQIAQVQLAADCTMQWVTFHPAQEKQ